MMFVDFEKAFDRITRSRLFRVLESFGVTGKFLSAVKSLYSKSLSAVRADGVTGNWFDVTLVCGKGVGYPHFCLWFTWIKLLRTANW